MIRLDNNGLTVTADEILAFAKVRNELLRLPWFLEYHRQLGVDRFFIVDNNSLDGSVDYLLSQNDVHLFSTHQSLAQSDSGSAWINPLLNTYAEGHWTLTLDADELFLYPCIEDVGLRELTFYLDYAGAEAMSTLLIDMYSSDPIRETLYSPGKSFLKACPYFDAEKPKDSYGGPRERLFWRGMERNVKPPYLTKIPLVKWRPGLSFEAWTHIIKDVNMADLTGALLHFKFFFDFHERVKEGVERKQYFEDSAQYACYLDTLQSDSGLKPFCSGSVRYEDSAQLVNMGFMNAPHHFIDYLTRRRTMSMALIAGRFHGLLKHAVSNSHRILNAIRRTLFAE